MTLPPGAAEGFLEIKQRLDRLRILQARQAPAARRARECDRLIRKFEERYGLNIRDSSATFNSVPIELQPQALKDLAEITRLEKITAEMLEAIMVEFGREAV